ncbi:hypothetical protein D3C85_1353870 [compost metagenome]
MVVQRLAHPFDGLMGGLDLSVPGHIEQVKTLASALLGHIHRLISVTQQGFGIFVVMGKQRDANTGKYIDVLAVQRVWRRDRAQHPVQRRPQLRQVAHVTQHQHKLVSGQPRHDILGANDTAQSFGHFHQQKIAGGMPVTIVNRLETVKVEHAHRQRDVLLS